MTTDKLFTKKDLQKFGEYCNRHLIRLIQEKWKAKCEKMEIMSGQVAIYELNQILGELKT